VPLHEVRLLSLDDSVDDLTASGRRLANAFSQAADALALSEEQRRKLVLKLVENENGWENEDEEEDPVGTPFQDDNSNDPDWTDGAEEEDEDDDDDEDEDEDDVEEENERKTRGIRASDFYGSQKRTHRKRGGTRGTMSKRGGKRQAVKKNANLHEDEDLSEYEKLRLRNIAEREELFRQLHIPQCKDALSDGLVKKRTAPVAKKKPSEGEPLPAKRVSLRLQSAQVTAEQSEHNFGMNTVPCRTDETGFKVRMPLLELAARDVVIRGAFVDPAETTFWTSLEVDVAVSSNQRSFLAYQNSEVSQGGLLLQVRPLVFCAPSSLLLGLAQLIG
jgi:hypothetical protein